MTTQRMVLVRRGLLLSYATLAYNSLEGVIAIIAGIIAGSIALVGFGADSLIELTAGAAALWRLYSDRDPESRERSERVAVRLIGACFLALAAYVAADATRSLLQRDRPEESTMGIILAVASLFVMPLLARSKRQVAIGLGSRALVADARQTTFCMYLSAILLGGLLLNAVLGWWWADPIAALLMVPIIAKEGVEGLRGKTCSDDCRIP